ncbi:MAG: hypothetical protein K1X28_08210 [Parachlamydiales bacterium]|nr:hypothetical protein [Parachlamydiales bacterium]
MNLERIRSFASDAGTFIPLYRDEVKAKISGYKNYFGEVVLGFTFSAISGLACGTIGYLGTYLAATMADAAFGTSITPHLTRIGAYGGATIATGVSTLACYLSNDPRSDIKLGIHSAKGALVPLGAACAGAWGAAAATAFTCVKDTYDGVIWLKDKAKKTFTHARSLNTLHELRAKFLDGAQTMFEGDRAFPEMIGLIREYATSPN